MSQPGNRMYRKNRSDTEEAGNPRSAWIMARDRLAAATLKDPARRGFLDEEPGRYSQTRGERNDPHSRRVHRPGERDCVYNLWGGRAPFSRPILIEMRPRVSQVLSESLTLPSARVPGRFSAAGILRGEGKERYPRGGHGALGCRAAKTDSESVCRAPGAFCI